MLVPVARCFVLFRYHSGAHTAIPTLDISIPQTARASKSFLFPGEEKAHSVPAFGIARAEIGA